VKRYLAILFLIVNLFGQGLVDFPEITDPDLTDIMWIETSVEDYKITLGNVYNKLWSYDNEWTGQNTYNGLTRFDSSVIMRGAQRYYSNDYTPGWLGNGFNLDYGQTYENESNLVIDNITVRGTMSVYELLLRRIGASNGGLVVSSAAKVIHAGGADSTWCFVEDPTGMGLAPFQVNDLLMVRIYDQGSTSIIRETKVTVDSVKTLSAGGENFAAVYITYNEGDRVQIGDVLVRMGNLTNTTRQNLIYLTSEDDGAPFIQFKEDIDSWSKLNDDSTTILFMGNLEGYNDVDFGALSGNGILLKNAYIKGRVEFTNASDIPGGTVIRSDTAPTNKTINGRVYPLSAGDQWIDTDDSNKPYTWSGSQWIQDYTSIYGGHIETGSLSLQSLDFTPILSSGGTGDIIATINASSEGIRISGDKIRIDGNVSFASGYDPDVFRAIIRAASPPATRPDGTTLKSGDQWIDTDDGDRPYTWNGSSWQRSLTSIDGGDLVTGSVTANEIDIEGVESALPGIAVIRSTTAPAFKVVGGRTFPLKEGDQWLDTDDGNKPYTYDGTQWIQDYTIISGGNIETGSVNLQKLSFTPISSVGGTGDIVATINASSEGIRISGSKIQIDGNVSFSAGYDPSITAAVMRQTSAPATRPDGTSLKEGDQWVDSDAGDRVYTWTGSSWQKAITQINGGEITTGFISAQRIASESITADKIDVDDLFAQNIDATGNIRGGSFTGGSYATAGPFWGGGLNEKGIEMNSSSLTWTSNYGVSTYAGISGNPGTFNLTISSIGLINITAAGEDINSIILTADVIGLAADDIQITGNLSVIGSYGLAISDLPATGTPSSSTYLRGDGTWATPSGGWSGSATSNLDMNSYNITEIGYLDIGNHQINSDGTTYAKITSSTTASGINFYNSTPTNLGGIRASGGTIGFIDDGGSWIFQAQGNDNDNINIVSGALEMNNVTTIRNDGTYVPPSMTTSSASNNSIFINSSTGQLNWESASDNLRVLAND